MSLYERPRIKDDSRITALKRYSQREIPILEYPGLENSPEKQEPKAFGRYEGGDEYNYHKKVTMPKEFQANVNTYDQKKDILDYFK